MSLLLVLRLRLRLLLLLEDEELLEEDEELEEEEEPLDEEEEDLASSGLFKLSTSPSAVVFNFLDFDFSVEDIFSPLDLSFEDFDFVVLAFNLSFEGFD